MQGIIGISWLVSLFLTVLLFFCGSDIRLVVVEGAGTLYLNKEHTQQLFESKDFPAEFLPLATSQGKQLDDIRKRNDVNCFFLFSVPNVNFLVLVRNPLACLLVIMLKIKLLPQFCARVKISLRS